MLTLTPVAWPSAGEDVEATVRQVHRWALARFIYVPDEQRWHGQYAWDHWESDEEIERDLTLAGALRGDCDAFAKLCWMALRRVGVKARLVECRVENGGGHLVCEASGWILDNRYGVVATRQELERVGYVWVSMSGFEPGETWTHVKGGWGQ